jgi:hypothetical protein
MLIHRVLNGPLTDDEDNILCLCLVEDDGELYEEEIIFEKMEDAINFSDHFKSSIEPIVLEQGWVDH